MLLNFQQLVSVVVKAFALGLFITIVLNWLNPPRMTDLQGFLNRFYDVFLNPIRRYVRPIRMFRDAPVGLDLAPLVLLALIWWIIHPFLMWVFA